jgi:hypothetical protein
MSLLTRLYLNSRKGFFRTLKKKRRFFHILTLADSLGEIVKTRKYEEKNMFCNYGIWKEN